MEFYFVIGYIACFLFGVMIAPRYVSQLGTALGAATGVVFISGMFLYIPRTGDTYTILLSGVVTVGLYVGLGAAVTTLARFMTWHFEHPPVKQPVPQPVPVPVVEPQVEPPYEIPENIRTEHMLILGGTGHGKTQAIQNLIAKDIDRDCTIIVIDSQGDLIRNIANLRIERERMVVIDPRDVEYPVALNLFDIGASGKKRSPAEREAYQNGVIELLEFVLGSVLGAELTQKQEVAFRFVIRLMLVIPNSTIHTLRELFSPEGYTKYARYIRDLSASAQAFFREEFNSREFMETRRQVVRRIYGILENETITRMFSHPQSKIDMFEEMNGGKIILINTDKQLLKESGSQLFGRFFIALIAQATAERATLRPYDRTRTYLYIDEAHEYIDRNVTTLLEQARKYNVGVILAHQSLGQLDQELQHRVVTNTSIKMVGGISAKDARALADDMGTKYEELLHIPKLSFFTSVKGDHHRLLSFEPGVLEKLPKRRDMPLLRALMREKYAGKIETPKKDEEESDGTNLFKT